MPDIIKTRKLCKRCKYSTLSHPSPEALRRVAAMLMRPPRGEHYLVAGEASAVIGHAAAFIDGICFCCHLEIKWDEEGEWKAAERAANEMPSEGAPAREARQ